MALPFHWAWIVVGVLVATGLAVGLYFALSSSTDATVTPTAATAQEETTESETITTTTRYDCTSITGVSRNTDGDFDLSDHTVGAGGTLKSNPAANAFVVFDGSTHYVWQLIDGAKTAKSDVTEDTQLTEHNESISYDGRFALIAKDSAFAQVHAIADGSKVDNVSALFKDYRKHTFIGETNDFAALFAEGASTRYMTIFSHDPSGNTWSANHTVSITMQGGSGKDYATSYGGIAAASNVIVFAEEDENGGHNKYLHFSTPDPENSNEYAVYQTLSIDDDTQGTANTRINQIFMTDDAKYVVCTDEFNRRFKSVYTQQANMFYTKTAAPAFTDTANGSPNLASELYANKYWITVRDGALHVDELSSTDGNVTAVANVTESAPMSSMTMNRVVDNTTGTVPVYVLSGNSLINFTLECSSTTT